MQHEVLLASLGFAGDVIIETPAGFEVDKTVTFLSPGKSSAADVIAFPPEPSPSSSQSSQST
jgi:hypothetical protein